MSTRTILPLFIELLEPRRLLSYGDLDPQFGAVNGLLWTDFGNTDTARDVLVQPDGKIVVAGTWDGGTPDFALARYNPNGTLDTTFGGGTFGFGSGMTHAFFGAAIGSSSDFASDIALQPDGKIVMVGHTNFSALGDNDFAIVRFNSDGSLDTGFSGDGKQTINFGFDDRATGVAVRPDGKIVVGGFLDNGAADFAVALLNSNGSFDPAFGNIGTFGFPGASTLNFGHDEFATDLALDEFNRIVLVGHTVAPGDGDIAVCRLQPTGTLDVSFNGNGVKLLNPGLVATISSVALDSQLRIVMLGTIEQTPGNTDVLLVREVSNGTSEDIALSINYGGLDRGQSVSLRPDDSIVLSGFTTTGTGTPDNFLVDAVTESGALDPLFNGQGKRVNLGADDEAYGVTTTFDGSIIVVGRSGSDFGIVRERGALDILFARVGHATLNWGNTDTANAVDVQADGKVIVAGTWDGGLPDFAIARYNKDGTLDTSFSGDGRTNITFGTGSFGDDEFATDLAIQPDGKIVVVGYTNNINGIPAIGGNDFAICRLNTDGTLDNTFGSGGKVTRNLGQNDRAMAVVIQPDGKIVVAGDWDGGASDFVVIRLNSNGTTDTTFGGGAFGAGSGVTNIFFGSSTASNRDHVTDVALAPDGDIVVCGYTDAAVNLNDFAIARFQPSGAIDTGWASNGRRIINKGGDDRASAVTVLSNGQILVAGSNFLGPDANFAGLRLLPNGSQDLSFGFDFSTFGASEICTDMVVQFDGKIVLTGYTNIRGENDFAALGLNADGTFNTSFSAAHNLPRGTSDAGAKLLVNIGSDDRSFGAALQPDGHIVMVGRTDGDFSVSRLSARMIAASATFEFETLQQAFVQFSSPVGLTASDFTLQNLTTGTTIPSAQINLANLGNGLARLRFPGASNGGIAGVLPDGNYRLTLPPGAATDSAGNSNVGTFSFDFFFLMGDANHDKRVNLLDFNTLAANFGLSGRTFSQGNFDYDGSGLVNLADFNLLAARFGAVLAAPSFSERIIDPDDSDDSLSAELELLTVRQPAS